MKFDGILFLGNNGDDALRRAFGRGLQRDIGGNHAQKLFELFERERTVRLFTAGKFHLNTDFVAAGEKLLGLPRAHFEIMRAGLEADSDSFQADLFLLLAVLAFALFAVVLELTEVHESAHGRLGVGRDLDEIGFSLIRESQSRGRLHDTEISPILIDDADG